MKQDEKFCDYQVTMLLELIRKRKYRAELEGLLWQQVGGRAANWQKKFSADKCEILCTGRCCSHFVRETVDSELTITVLKQVLGAEKASSLKDQHLAAFRKGKEFSTKPRTLVCH